MSDRGHSALEALAAHLLGAAHGERGGVRLNSSSENMSIAPMTDLLIVLSSGAQAPARYLPPLPAQLRRERLNCIVEPTAHRISRGIKVGASPELNACDLR